MSIQKIIKTFSAGTQVPVDVNKVVEELQKLGVQDEIYFWEAEVNSEHLRGALVQWEPWNYPIDSSGVNVRRVADIYYAKSLTPDWRRLVSCKELLHILDVEYARSNTSQKVQALVEKIILPPELQDAMKDGIEVNTDRVAIYEAVAVLFPWEARQLLSMPFKAGKFTARDIAQMVDLPERFITVAMSSIWDSIYAVLSDRGGDADE